MSTGIFSIGISGMQAAQIGLMTTEHNITNAKTDGYNRQRVIQANAIPLATGSGFIGQGVQVTTIERLYDGFLSQQVSNAQTNVSQLNAYQSQISEIDNMLADKTAGLSPALQSFFTGVQSVASDPTLVSSRQSMISAAQTLVGRFQTISGRLNELYQGVNTNISNTVASINSYAQQIAAVNQRILVAQSSVSQPPNDLLDQRDQLVSEVNKLIKVTTATDSDGSMTVLIGNGQQLVIGNQASTLTAAASKADPSRIAVGIATNAGAIELPESLLTGGSLSGYLTFRSQSLDPAANDLGRVAASLTQTFNAQFALGQNLQGNINGDPTFQSTLFAVSSPKVVANALNPSTSPNVTATLSPASNTSMTTGVAGNFYTNLTNSDYRLTVGSSGLTLTRLTDNKAWTGADVTAINSALSSDPQGFTLNAVTFAASDVGASYLIQPTHDAATNISLNQAVVADTRLLNVAAPIRTLATATNAGSATMSNSFVSSGYSAASLPATLTYNSGNLSGFPNGTVTITNGNTTTNYTIASATDTVPYTSGTTISFSGMSFQISGQPASGDTFNISRNTNGVADNRNVKLLGNLQTQNTMTGATATYQAAYSQMVSNIGNKAQEIKVTAAAQQTLLEQSQAARDSFSGVNTDEEAANLLRYQQAYQASAKALDIGSKLFDTLLSITN
ncbi:flagellar hook-associated protein FlgK [Rhodocyclus tenuis]|uniref:flagellar hook-associated protein FlgK n=1 Tax=Rhodocyclus gracilis TaxID=2929842 RepID=UPI001298DFA0|nr:flagellar hook-associated protein FlgK [Rhodocyclus gracilis]MRD73082.1 flagellar hook-associated protein FlgK [Rhodocyclus gracilis]